MWGGRFADGPSAIMREINASIPFDKALWRQDIAGSRTHVSMLAAQGILTTEDAQTIDDGLQALAGYDVMRGSVSRRTGEQETQGEDSAKNSIHGGISYFR